MTSSYYDVKGRIFDIQKFSVQDGPGIRTIVFFKGCVLKCKWCCNPESQHYEIEKMLVEGKEKTIGRDVTVKEVLKEVLKDRTYYQRSGGGLTLSGGEALCQPDFGEALLYGAKEQGIHTAMESMGCAEFTVIERYLKNLDLYLMDIKHMNGEKHKSFTGKDNSQMLENARKITQSSNTKLVIRVPVIPTFNDTKEEIKAIAEFAAKLKGVEELHLLPYHRLGQEKYKGLNRTYELMNIPLLDDEKMLSFEAEVKKTGLKVQIGG